MVALVTCPWVVVLDRSHVAACVCVVALVTAPQIAEMSKEALQGRLGRKRVESLEKRSRASTLGGGGGGLDDLLSFPSWLPSSGLGMNVVGAALSRKGSAGNVLTGGGGGGAPREWSANLEESSYATSARVRSPTSPATHELTTSVI